MLPPKKNGLVVAIGMKPPALKTPGSKYGDEPQPDQPQAAHESAETPQEEQGEDYGAKILADIDSVGKEFGADSETARAACAKFLSAIAKCLSGESGGDDQQQPEAGGEQFGGGDEGYGA